MCSICSYIHHTHTFHIRSHPIMMFGTKFVVIDRDWLKSIRFEFSLPTCWLTGWSLIIFDDRAFTLGPVRCFPLHLVNDTDTVVPYKLTLTLSSGQSHHHHHQYADKPSNWTEQNRLFDSHHSRLFTIIHTHTLNLYPSAVSIVRSFFFSFVLFLNCLPHCRLFKAKGQT